MVNKTLRVSCYMLVLACRVEVAAAVSSSDKAEALKGGMQQQEEGPSSARSSADDSSQIASSSRSSTDRPKPSKKVSGALVWIDLEMTGETSGMSALMLRGHCIVPVTSLAFLQVLDAVTMPSCLSQRQSWTSGLKAPPPPKRSCTLVHKTATPLLVNLSGPVC